MTIITISRQFGSGGDEIAARLCEVLGYQRFDKSLIAKAAMEAGLSEQEIIDYSEENHKVRTFLDRLLNRAAVLSQVYVWTESGSAVESIEVSEEVMVQLVQKAVLKAYEAGNVVIVGRGSQVILQDKPGVLHVRIEAPIEDRIQRTKEQFKEAQKKYDADIGIRRKAQDWILERDEASADYIRRFYHVDWTDRMLYHIILNTGKLSIEHAVDVIAGLAKQI